MCVLVCKDWWPYACDCFSYLVQLQCLFGQIILPHHDITLSAAGIRLGVGVQIQYTVVCVPHHLFFSIVPLVAVKTLRKELTTQKHSSSTQYTLWHVNVHPFSKLIWNTKWSWILNINFLLVPKFSFSINITTLWSLTIRQPLLISCTTSQGLGSSNYQRRYDMRAY